MENIFTEEKWIEAVLRLVEKNDSCGIDGVYVSQYKEYSDVNHMSILKQSYDGTYRPDTVQLMEVLKKNGKKRMLSKYTCTDRVVLDILKNYLTPMWECAFSEHSYAYREGKGVVEAVKTCMRYINEGQTWVVELDIKDFFDNINIERMLRCLREKIHNRFLLELLHRYLYTLVQDDNRRYRKKCGLVQGNPLSPLLSNVYMQEFDNYMGTYHFCRFSDNINIYCDSFEEAQRIMCDTKKYLLDNLGLECNQDKSGVYLALSRRFLGYEFYTDKNRKQVYA